MSTEFKSSKKMYNNNKSIPDTGERHHNAMANQHRFHHYQEANTAESYSWHQEDQQATHQDVVILQLDPNTGVQIPIPEQQCQQQFMPQQLDQGHQIWDTDLHQQQQFDHHIMKAKRPSDCSSDEGYRSPRSSVSHASSSERTQQGNNVSPVENANHKLQCVDPNAQKITGCPEQQHDPNSGNLMWLLDFKLDFFNDNVTSQPTQDNQTNQGNFKIYIYIISKKKKKPTTYIKCI